MRAHKSWIIWIGLMFCSAAVFAQQTVTPRQLGVTISGLGENAIVYPGGMDPLGSASYRADNFFTVGINYIHPLNHWLEIETGIEYSRHTILISLMWPTLLTAMPVRAGFSLINIPATLRVRFLKYFFVNAGLILDIDPGGSSPVDSQAGIGSVIGLGGQYDFGSGISLFINPYQKFHAMVPVSFAGGDHRQKVWENGFRIGLIYHFANQQKIKKEH